MAYARKMYRRRPRKYLRKRRTGVKRVTKSVKTYVKRAIHRTIENKLAATGSNFSIVSAKESAYYVNAQAIIPPTSFGTGGEGARVGNQIRCVKGQMRAVFSLRPYSASDNSQPQPVWVKVWFIRTLATAYQGTGLSNAFLDNFFRTQGGSTGFQGTLYDLCNMPNNEAMRVLATRQFKLGVGYASATGGTGTYGQFDNSPASKCITINWGKWVKKQLKFDESLSASLPFNDNLYMVCQVVHANNTYTAGDYPVGCTFVSDMLYEDA